MLICGTGSSKGHAVGKILRSSFILKANVDLLAKTELLWQSRFVPLAQYFANVPNTL
jgi:hypothetical protein